MTLKNLDEFNQKAMEKYFRHCVQKKLDAFLLAPAKSYSKGNKVAMNLPSDSHLVRYLKQLTEDRPGVLDSFYFQLVNIEDEIIPLYENSVPILHYKE